MIFDAMKAKNACMLWIQDWFDKNGHDCNAIIGISGGKDSSAVAALCVEALGADRVIGVMMPNGVQKDIQDARHLVDCLNIKSYTINIAHAYTALETAILEETGLFSKQTATNMPARLRMTTLYAISQSNNGRVVNTCNLSEDWVGYSTRYGDSVGDLSPLAFFTVAEVKEIARALHLPEELVEKTPADGLSGLTDEDNLGFTYQVLDQYIRTGVCEDLIIKEKIDALHQNNAFKLKYMDCFKLS